MPNKTSSVLPPYFEADIIDGLGDFAATELHRLKGIRHLEQITTESIRFNYRNKRNWEQLAALRLSNAVYFVQPFAVPRPKALLGHANWQLILSHIERTLDNMPLQPFHSFFLSAAGQQSAVFQRFEQQLESAISLPLAEEGGDLLIRVRRGHQGHWEIMVRLTPRPLLTRRWRVADMRGALNGPLAAVMADLSHPTANDRVLNVMCGSASLLVERGLVEENDGLIGCDLNPAALTAAQQNLNAARLKGELYLADGQALPFGAQQFDTVLADFPWGHLVGTHSDNQQLHPKVMAEMARVIRPHGRCVIITHEVQIMERILRQQPVWRKEKVIRLKRGNIQPRIYALQRES